MRFPNKEQVARVLGAYPVGAMVECVSIADPYTSIPPGTMGEVTEIDDSGTVFVKFRNDVTIGAVYGVDVIKRITPMSDKVLSQLLEVRATGRSNMLDTQTVQRIAFDMGLYDLVDFIESDRRAYVRVILTGETLAP